MSNQISHQAIEEVHPDLIETAACRYGTMSFFKNDTTIGRSLREYGEWAQLEVDALCSLIEPGTSVVDAGAFIGTHSLAFARLVGSSGFVYAFEPQPAFFELLRRNVTKNGLGDRIRVIPCGLSSHESQILTQSVDSEHAANYGGIALQSTEHYARVPNYSSRQHLIALKTLDGMQIDRLSLLKIDTEGMEIDVLTGAEKTIEATRPIIAAECNSLSYAWPVVEFGYGRGYKSFLLNLSSYNPDNFRGSSVNFFGECREASLIMIPDGRYSDLMQRAVNVVHQLIPIDSIDDLALGLLKKPQYKDEILAKTKAAQILGVAFWDNEVERDRRQHDSEANRQRIATLESEQRTIFEHSERVTLTFAQEMSSMVAIASERGRLLDAVNAQLIEAFERNKEMASVTLELSTRLNDALSARSKAVEDLARYAADLDDAKARNAGLMIEIQGLRAALDDAKATRDAAFLETEELRTSGEHALRALSEKTAELGSLNSKLTEMTEGRERLQTRAQQLAEQIARYRSAQKESQQCHLESMDRLNGRLGEAEELIAELRQQLKNREEDAQSQLFALQSQHAVEVREAQRSSARLNGDLIATQTFLNQILQSRGWHLLSVYYRWRHLIASIFPRRIRMARQQRSDLKLLRMSRLFDPSWYLSKYTDVAAAGTDPALHFLLHGADEGRNPSPLFHTNWYRQQYPDVATAGDNPLIHYLRRGAAEGRSPLPDDRQVDEHAKSPSEAAPDTSACFPSSNTRSESPRILTVQEISFAGHIFAKTQSQHVKGPLVCFTHVLPWPSRAGNEYRIDRLLNWLTGIGYDVYLVVCPLGDYSISEEMLAQACQHYRNLIVCDRSGKISYHLERGKALVERLSDRHIRDFSSILQEDNDTSLNAKLLHCFRTFCPDALVEVILGLTEVLRPKVVLAEYVFTTRVLPLLDDHCITIVDTIDVFSTKARKVEKFGVVDSLALRQDEEARLLRDCDIVVAIQEEEAEELRALAPLKPVVTAGIDYAQVKAKSRVPAEPVVLVVASDNAMNTKGLKDFLRFAWPLIRRDIPNAMLRVVGSVGKHLEIDDSSIQIAGYVEDLSREYEQARVVINPAVAGTGLKIKTVEALCHLCPLVTWPAGVDGVAPNIRALCHIETDWYSFAARVINLCISEELCQNMIDKRDEVAAAFTSDKVYYELNSAIEDLSMQKATIRR